MKKHSHSLQLLLPVCLLSAFIAAAMLAVLLSASAYRDILDRSNQMTEATALTYIGEKVRRSDTAGSVRLDTIGSCPALVIRQGQERLYDTYIYCYGGSLRELMIKVELTPEPDMGRALVPMEGLDLTMEDGLISLTLVAPSGMEYRSCVCLRSEEGVG